MPDDGESSEFSRALGEKTQISSNLTLGSKKLASAIVLGHAVSHVFNSSLPLLLAMMKTDPRF
ncbi:uncharacterized protein METZ01_LOCUS248151, partial [marine metagenome]